MTDALPYKEMPPAEIALSILFKKLHPLLEDADHALKSKAKNSVLESLHVKLLKARIKSSELILRTAEETSNEELRVILESLASDLTPVGENFQQSLTLTQLCLEEVPKDLVGFIAEGVVSTSPWGKRMIQFLEQLEKDNFHAELRWKHVDDAIGDNAL